MTSPVPQEVADPTLDTMSGAVVAQQESPCIMRIGVVTAIIEGSQITVKISGSPVLINCSYLFAQYFPLLGDRVIVFKQDSQWFSVGQMSGSIESNNPLYNSSFEIGDIGATPTGWAISVLASGAGTPTFDIAASTTPENVSGKQMVDFGTNSVGAGTSIAEVFSTATPAAEGTHWTGAYFLTTVVMNSVPPQISSLQMYIQFLSDATTVIAEYAIDTLGMNSYVISTVYRRLSLAAFPAGYVEAPPGTNFARVKFRGSFELPAASFSSFFIDNVILRQVD